MVDDVEFVPAPVAVPSAALVNRAAALVGYMSSTPNGPHIPWDDWKKGAVGVDIPHDISYTWTFVLGSRVLLMTHDWRANRGRYRVQAHNFSRWRCRALVRVGDGGRKECSGPIPRRPGSHGGVATGQRTCEP